MDHIRKMRSKMFKKTRQQSACTQPTLKEKLRHSQSMPFRNSNDTQNSVKTRPVYRGTRPLRPSDIHIFVDISQDADELYGNNAWLSRGYNDDEEQYRRRPSILDTNVIDEFPSPPDMHAYSCSRPRPSLSSTVSIHCDQVTSDDHANLAPSASCERRNRAKARERKLAEEAEYKACYPNRQPMLQRSSSSSSYSRPTRIAYPTLSNGSQTQPTSYVQPISDQTSFRPAYGTTHPNFSTRSLGANVSLREGPVAHRPVVQQGTTRPLRPRKASSSTTTTGQKSGVFSTDAMNAIRGAETAERLRLRSTPAHYQAVSEEGYYVDPYYHSTRSHAATMHGRAEPRF